MKKRNMVWWLVALPLLFGAEAGEEAEPLWATLQQPPATSPGSRAPAFSFTALVERARPAVVAIRTIAEEGSGESGWLPGTFDPWRLFPDAPRRQEGIGSGFIVREDGYVVTNHHVVADADAVRVHVEGLGQVLTARVVGSDPRSDLALLKVESRRRLPVLPLGSSERLPVGAWVVAIGNPFGLAHVATKGIVSGKGRTLGDLRFRPGYLDYIQTDAAIDRGNSGGPLLNLNGEVVGINTAINSRARGIGFAVPVDLAKAVLPQLLRYGRVIRTFLGIRIDGVTWELAESFGMKTPEGVLITRVIPKTPAERAGLKKGDIILKFAGLKVRGPGDMGWRAATATAGRPVEMEVWRDRKLTTVSITPVARKSEPAKQPASSPAEADLKPPRLGLFVVDLDPATAEHGGFEQGTRGVVVVGAEADAAIFGIRVGDVITSVNDREIKNKEEFEEAVGEVKKDQIIRFYILRQKGARFVAIPKRWE
jgi:serine protease Do